MWLSVMLANFRIVGSSKDSNGFKKNSCIPLNFLMFFFPFSIVCFFEEESSWSTCRFTLDPLLVLPDPVWKLYKKKKKKRKNHRIHFKSTSVLLSFSLPKRWKKFHLICVDMIWYLDLDMISRRKWKKKIHKITLILSKALIFFCRFT